MMQQERKKIGRLPYASARGPQNNEPVSIPRNTDEVNQAVWLFVRPHCILRTKDKKLRSVISMPSEAKQRPHASWSFLRNNGERLLGGGV
jgi:hypothetical protein